MTKLNDTQIQVLKAVEFQGNVADVTVHPSTLKALKTRGLIAEDGTITDTGREAIGVVTEVETTESVEEDAPVPFFNRTARRGFRRNVARYNRALMRLKGKRTKRFGSNVVIKHAA
jgi:hypothetical protein